MLDFAYLRAICNASSHLSKSVIDDFLIPYAAERERLVPEMNIRFGKYRKVTQVLQAGWVNMFKAQYIGHRIFKKDGLIKKYARHSAFKELTPAERKFLDEQTMLDWRFSFSFILGSPDMDFYEMEDAFSGESYLLYSRSVSQNLAEGNVSLWFNLIGFNGQCWQTFGPVIGYRCFEPDDIFFFATELNSQIETEKDLMTDLDANPVPYMMLVSGANYPATVNGDDEIVQVIGEYPLPGFDSSLFKAKFTVGYADDTYQLKPKKYGEPPHVAAAYFSEKENKLLLTALTDKGYAGLAKALSGCGLEISAEPDIRVHLPMLICIKDVLGKELHLNPYEELFHEKSTPQEKAKLEPLNKFVALALPYINEGQTPDIAALAKEAGVEVETGKQLLEAMATRLKTLKGKAGKGKKNKR